MKAKIFIVDDEEGLRFSFKRFLTSEGYEVIVAKDYDEAVREVERQEFDVIFADIVLGSATGIDFLSYIRERNITCPVIMITGYPGLDTATEALRLGAFDYITKPVRKETLIRVARLALQHKLIREEKEKYRSHFEAVFRSVEDGIITVDKDFNIIEANSAVKNILAFYRDFTGKILWDFLDDPGGKFHEALDFTMTHKKPFKIDRIEYKMPGKGRKVLTVSTAPLIDSGGIFSGIVIVVRDETRVDLLERELKERQEFHNIKGRSAVMQEVYSMIEVLAEVETTVLITGESGTGKELAAEALHYKGRRAGRTLVKVNCSALSENLLESELFGHVKGAFTGAFKDKKGRFELADKGTIFLDEIGDISPGMQVRLLRVLQESEFERVGDEKTIKVDVRIVAATNQDLKEKVRKGEFREDLYYRLRVVEVKLPPLRERKEDIFLLTEHFMKKFNLKFSKNITAISEDVEKLFMNYSWPGNIRELQHALEYAFILCKGPVITLDSLPSDIKTSDSVGVSKFREDWNRPEVIRRALEKCRWNKAKAARLLGMNRRTIYRKMEKYGISDEGS